MPDIVRNIKYLTLCVTMMLAAFINEVQATSGRTNSSGCHNSRTAGYHCHGTQPPSKYPSFSVPRQPAPSPSIPSTLPSIMAPSFDHPLPTRSMSSSASAVGVSDLFSEISRDSNISVTKITGMGASSGSSLRGVLVNKSVNDIKVSVNFSEPLFFHNWGDGQNMVATQVFLGDGSYLSAGSQSFIVIPSRGSVDVIFIAYCADFEKENPSPLDKFGLTTVPEKLRDISRSIASYERLHLGEDLTAAAQVALWLSQGVSAEDIRSRFSFTPVDHQHALEIIGSAGGKNSSR